MRAIVTAMYYILTGQIVETWFMVEILRDRIDEMRKRIETFVGRM